MENDNTYNKNAEKKYQQKIIESKFNERGKNKDF